MGGSLRQVVRDVARRSLTLAGATVMIASLAWPSSAWADGSPTVRDGGAAEKDQAEARAEFQRGVEFGEIFQWSAAMAAFQRSARLQPDPLTTYHVGRCARSLGYHAIARVAFARALEENEAGGGKRLAPALQAEIHTLVDELDRVLARVTVTIEPEGAAIAVDGRPLTLLGGAGEAPILIADVHAPGPGEPPPRTSFTLFLEPQVHVLTLSRRGFADRVMRVEYSAGARASLKLELDRLPARLHISANRPGAVVSLDGLDVGVVPVDLQRPPGAYRAEVRSQGFLAYRTRLVLGPGEEANLHAELELYRPPIYKKWWFWSVAAVALAGVGVGVYFLVRPGPTLDGGGLGWTIQAR